MGCARNLRAVRTALLLRNRLLQQYPLHRGYLSHSAGVDMSTRILLLSAIAMSGCRDPLPPGDDKYFGGDANIFRASVVRETDGSTLYEGCWVVGKGDVPSPPVPFRAAPSELVRVGADEVRGGKLRSSNVHPHLHCPRGDA